MPPVDYDTSLKVFRKVHRDCQLSSNGNRYTVPYRMVGKRVLLKVKGGLVRIYDDQDLLAAYQEPRTKHNLLADPRFYEELKTDKEQAIKKYGTRKGKATRGLVNDSLYVEVTYRPLAEYETLCLGRCRMEQLTCEHLQDNLKRLKLTRAAEVLNTIVAHSEQDQASYLSFLDQLLEEEVAAKEKRRIETALKIVSLSFAKTIEEYDFSFHPRLDKKAVIEIFDLTFLTNHENVIFLGPPGVGKTHLAIALAIKACSHGSRSILPP